jgi:hypothetical protein
MLGVRCPGSVLAFEFIGTTKDVRIRRDASDSNFFIELLKRMIFRVHLQRRARYYKDGQGQYESEVGRVEYAKAFANFSPGLLQPWGISIERIVTLKAVANGARVLSGAASEFASGLELKSQVLLRPRAGIANASRVDRRTLSLMARHLQANPCAPGPTEFLYGLYYSPAHAA